MPMTQFPWSELVVGHLPPFLQKLWDKGVDIAAGLIVSGITAVIALASWKVKLWLDLKADEAKHRRQHARDLEFERERSRKDALERDERLQKELLILADEAGKVMLKSQLQSMMTRYSSWLTTNHLEHLSANAQNLSEIASWASLTQSAAQVPGLKTQLEQMIRKTELPEPPV